MAVSAWDGRFALECWDDAESEEDGEWEYGDDLEELRARAEKLIQAGRYVYISLTRYNSEEDDCDELEVFEAE